MTTSTTDEQPSDFTAIDVHDAMDGEQQRTAGGQPSDSLRDQSSRLSNMLKRKTEVYAINRIAPEPTTPNDGGSCTAVESSGWNYWVQEMGQAKVHGGDYPMRHRAAFRAALGSLSLFSILVFPDHNFFRAVWIGNIFMHTNLKDSFGASLLSIKDFSKSIVLTTVFSTPVAYFLSTLSTKDASILFPFLVFTLSFIIMTCPQLASRNLMILCMYLAIAAPVRNSDVDWWLPFGYMGTYHLGLAIALVVNVCNFALDAVYTLLSRQEKDLTMLLLECKAYADNTGATPEVSRSAMATIETLCNRIALTTKSLKAKLPAAEVELLLRCRGKAARDLTAWLKQSERLLTPLNNIRSSLSQRVVGEEHSAYSDRLREAKAILKKEAGPARDRMLDAMIASIAVCHAWANPSAHRSVLPDVERELEVSIEECRSSFHRAMTKAAEWLEEANPQTNNTPVFAHLTRRMCAFNALFELGDSLLMYLREHSWEAEEAFGQEEYTIRHRRNVVTCLCGQLRSFVDFIELKWLWHKPDTLRLALKTSTGMFLASMFVSVPYLWTISSPFGVWPGLTIASVNLASTGSSFAKAADRLFGTLLAAAFALLVSDLFPGSNADYVKLPAIGFFTYAVIYLRSTDHAYKFTYAATSIGAMLYGSATSNFNIATYVPKRIELIFVGVVVFSFVELFLFPRSSRRLVETSSYQCFLNMRDYLKQAAHCTRRMENHILRSLSEGWKEDSDAMFFDDVNDPYHLERLASCHEKFKAETSRIKKELEAGLDEPNLGLSIMLNPGGFRGLARELSECEVQSLLLLKALRDVAGYYQQNDHPIRRLNWPGVHAEFLEDISGKADSICQWLACAFPDGRLRPQLENSIKPVTAAASFRQIEEVRLRIIAGWSRNYYLETRERGRSTDPVATIMALGITTTYILELCRHYQKAGKHLETIVHKFPATD